MKKTYRNIAFLAELLINILVFSVSCAVLVGVFGKAGTVSRDTGEQSLASTEVNALIETVRLRGEAGLEGAVRQTDGSYVCNYDAAWRPTTQTPVYVVTVQLTEEQRGAGTLVYITAQAESATGREICIYDTAHYIPAEGGAVGG